MPSSSSSASIHDERAADVAVRIDGVRLSQTSQSDLAVAAALRHAAACRPLPP